MRAEWLKELKSQGEKYLPGDTCYSNEFFDYLNLLYCEVDRLIEIVEGAEWLFLCPSGRRYCEFCGGQKPGTKPTGLADVFFGHLSTCPYSDEWTPK